MNGKLIAQNSEKNRFVADRFQNMILSPLSKTNEMVRRYSDVIDLSIGDPDYSVDRRIIEEMYAGGLAGHTRYTEFLGDSELRQETIKWYKEDYDFSINSDEIMITAGGTHAMYLLLSSILNPGDQVIVIAPYYVYYTLQVEIPGGTLIPYNTKGGNNFDVVPEELEMCITEKTKAIIVNSPCNPSGKVYSEETIKEILKLAEKYDFLVIADDIYGALNYTDNTKPICAYEGRPERIATVYSYSKDYVMTGFRLGHIIAPNKIIECARNINEAVTFTVNSMAQRAGIYAIKNRKEIQSGIYEEYRKRVFYIYERICKLNKIDCRIPEGTFYIFADIRKTGLSSIELWEKLLEEAHVLVLPGSGFGAAGEGFIRIAATVGVDVIEEAFDRIEKSGIFA